MIGCHWFTRTDEVKTIHEMRYIIIIYFKSSNLNISNCRPYSAAEKYEYSSLPTISAPDFICFAKVIKYITGKTCSH